MKSKQYILKVNDAVTAGKVFMLLEDLDISNTSIERVDHSELESIKDITRSKAIKNAREKAFTLTRPLGQTVGMAIYISDNENAENPDNRLQGRAAGLLIRGTNSYDKFKVDLPKIEFEKIKVSSVVNVKFILK